MSTAYTNISDAAAARHRLEAQLSAHIAESKKEETRLRRELERADSAVRVGAGGMDLELIAIANTVLEVWGLYEKAGDERAGVIRDAIAEIATSEKQGFRGLWRESFGTKDYAHWHGQRSDHEYGYGPRHGTVIFSVGLRREVREREPRELTAAEREACVYYLVNLQAIQNLREAQGAAA